MTTKKILLLLLTATLVASPTITLAATTTGLQPVVNFTGTASGNDLLASLSKIINGLLTLAVIIAVIFVVIGGVRYTVSQGDEDAQVLAKNTIIYAVIGIVVIALSAVIVNFVLRYV